MKVCKVWRLRFWPTVVFVLVPWSLIVYAGSEPFAEFLYAKTGVVMQTGHLVIVYVGVSLLVMKLASNYERESSNDAE